jgi:hypothetical protein
MVNETKTTQEMKKTIRKAQKELNDDLSRTRRELNKKRW